MRVTRTERRPAPAGLLRPKPEREPLRRNLRAAGTALAAEFLRYRTLFDVAAQEYSEAMGTQVVNEHRRCPMCGSETWILLDGRSVLQALEGGLEALAYSCRQCGFIRWHRSDKAEQS